MLKHRNDFIISFLLIQLITYSDEGVENKISYQQSF